MGYCIKPPAYDDWLLIIAVICMILLVLWLTGCTPFSKSVSSTRLDYSNGCHFMVQGMTAEQWVPIFQQALHNRRADLTRACEEAGYAMAYSWHQEFGERLEQMIGGAAASLGLPYARELVDRLREYREWRRGHGSATELTQVQVDQIFHGVGRPTATLPKGLSVETMELVVGALTEADDALSAEDVAQVTGISRDRKSVV